jgi:hypothetical protein
MNEPPPNPAARAGVPDWLADGLTGAGLGLLTGLLLGLSISEVVGSVLAALVALLGAFFGLRPAGDGVATEAAPAPPNRARIGAFAVSAAFAALLGVVIRTHQLLAPSVPAQVRVWTEAGYDDQQARALVMYERLGITPAGATIAEGSRAASQLAASLFATGAESRCDDLSAAALPDVGNRLQGFAVAGGNWAAVATAVQGASSATQGAVLDAAWKLVCAP